MVPLMHRSQSPMICAGLRPRAVGHLRQAVADGQGAVLRGRGGLEQLHVAELVGEDEIGEGARPASMPRR